MIYQYYYCREHKCWYAYWMDGQGNQLGDPVFTHSKEQVLIQLGMVKKECLKLKQMKDAE